jgi:hypothetical protein
MEDHRICKSKLKYRPRGQKSGYVKGKEKMNLVAEFKTGNAAYSMKCRKRRSYRILF